jgi:hypothetical protein
MNENIKKMLRPIFWWIESHYYFFLGLLFPSEIKDAKQIPIIINNRNRITFLIQLIESLEKRGYRNIYIIDNNSSYPPLLEYYKLCPYHVFRLNRNVGYQSLWKTDIYKRFIKDYYVYTDSDVVPIDECPDNFMDFFLETLKKFKFVEKVGFSLKIDDLPDCFTNKNSVIEWESQFYVKKVNELLYLAPIDTTFALYRPFIKKEVRRSHQIFRTAYPYSARHMPWYVDSSNPEEEEKYYNENTSTSTHWTILNQ